MPVSLAYASPPFDTGSYEGVHLLLSGGGARLVAERGHDHGQALIAASLRWPTALRLGDPRYHGELQ